MAKCIYKPSCKVSIPWVQSFVPWSQTFQKIQQNNIHFQCYVWPEWRKKKKEDWGFQRWPHGSKETGFSFSECNSLAPRLLCVQYLFSVGCCQQMAYSEWREISLRNKEKLGLNRKLNMFLGLQLMIKELQTSDLQLDILPAANTHCF